MQRMQLSREDFDNPEVAGAVNPTPTTVTSRSHPEPNPTAPTPGPPHTYAPTPGSRLSGINSMVCDIAVNGNQMCGQPVRSQIALRRHIRNAHPGATLNPFRTNIPQAERIRAKSYALKRWILSRGWRTARYVKEPGEGPMYGIIQDYCNFLEQLAQEDDDFAQQFGTEFHRPRLGKPPTPPSAPKRKRAPPKKGHKATGSRKQPARARRCCRVVPETA
ncbi:uncharacterized protein ATNIH1004_000012 [Aspergillus tanneri]|uniref:Uncharacterized protein n=1 Tax=Aspergillus tanneri TaxID=1220188 RepID=A0A5M9N0L1_9EURO|nr:uncharacterized protein ATNIH1004_000012 [Aspergillus tanneri]KAA8651134.1 hypothetical protein ATNIH1004_000012 [Aspergillus tanneri]